MLFFWQTLQIVAPVFMLAFIGILLKKPKIIDAHFVDLSSRLVFNVALPCLVFVKLSVVDFHQLFRPGQIVYVCAGTAAVFLLIWILARFWIRSGSDLGAFVQGSFRSNFSIVGFAIVWKLFGEQGLAQAAVILAFVMPLYNFLSIVVLTVTTHHQKLPLKTLLCRVITNPLMISVLVALAFSLMRWRLHAVLFNTAEILSRLALPLALLGIGGSLNLEAVRKVTKMAIHASMIKIIAVPVVLTYGAVLAGFRGQDLAIMFICFGCPTAVTSFVMADAMGANSKLASNIILLSTLGATFTITTGIVVLTHWGMI
ncbi:AEC family transporter [bacterium]|nr:AEC family transporter [bacterium]